MRYVLLIYEPGSEIEKRVGPETGTYVAAWRAYYKALVEAKVYVDGLPLKDAATGTTLRLRDGRRRVQDGPFAEAREELGGFIILEAPSLDAALDWAARCPAAAYGTVEVRPVDAEYDSIVRA
jgi:hypothetical protein